MAPTAKKSKTWEFFTELGEHKAKCTICSKILSHKGAGPYNLTRHLKSFHPLVLTGIQEDRMALLNSNANINATDSVAIPLAPAFQLVSTSQGESSTACSNESTQLVPAAAVPIRRPQVHANKINEYFSKPLSLKKTEIVNKMLLEMIVKNYLPFTIVESDSFRTFIQELSPSYMPPSRKTLSNALLLKYYNIVRENVAKVLREAEYIALTTDAWTSSSHQQYVSVTAHFIINTNIN